MRRLSAIDRRTKAYVTREGDVFHPSCDDPVHELRKRVAVLEAAGDLLYLQVLDANGWINLGATWPGAGLCICSVAGVEKYDPEILEAMTEQPTEHDIVCTPFRAALAAWKTARPERA